jgi:hypothetical protein
MKVRLDDRIYARRLRQNGLSFSEIMAKIPDLSKSTLNGWLKNVELTSSQKIRILQKIKTGADKGRVKGAFKNHQKRLLATVNTIRSAKEEIMKRNIDGFFIAGVMLYWAEGRKSEELVELTNSDPEMIKLMMAWFRKVCTVDEHKFRIRINIHSLLDKNKTEKYWSNITEIPISQFNKTIVKSTQLVGRRNPKYVGTCSIIISDKCLFRRISGWKQGLLENINLFAPVAQWTEQVNSNH